MYFKPRKTAGMLAAVQALGGFACSASVAEENSSQNLSSSRLPSIEQRLRPASVLPRATLGAEDMKALSSITPLSWRIGANLFSLGPERVSFQHSAGTFKTSMELPVNWKASPTSVRSLSAAKDFSLGVGRLGLSHFSAQDPKAGVDLQRAVFGREGLEVRLERRDVDQAFTNFSGLSQLSEAERKTLAGEQGIETREVSASLKPSDALSLNTSVSTATNKANQSERRTSQESVALKLSGNSNLEYAAHSSSSTSAEGSQLSDTDSSLLRFAKDTSGSSLRIQKGEVSSSNAGQQSTDTESLNGKLTLKEGPLSSVSFESRTTTAETGELLDKSRQVDATLTPGTLKVHVNTLNTETKGAEKTRHALDVASEVGKSKITGAFTQGEDAGKESQSYSVAVSSTSIDNLALQGAMASSSKEGTEPQSEVRVAVATVKPIDTPVIDNVKFTGNYASVDKGTTAKTEEIKSTIEGSIAKNKVTVDYSGTETGGKQDKEKTTVGISRKGIAGEPVQFEVVQTSREIGGGEGQDSRLVAVDWTIDEKTAAKYTFQKNPESPQGVIQTVTASEFSLKRKLSAVYTGFFEHVASFNTAQKLRESRLSVLLQGAFPSRLGLKIGYSFTKKSPESGGLTGHGCRLEAERCIGEDNTFKLGATFGRAAEEKIDLTLKKKF